MRARNIIKASEAGTIPLASFFARPGASAEEKVVPFFGPASVGGMSVEPWLFPIAEEERADLVAGDIASAIASAADRATARAEYWKAGEPKPHPEPPPDPDELRLQAYQEGLTRGLEEGRAAGREELRGVLERFLAAAAALEQEREALWKESQPAMVEVALTVAREVVRAEARDRRDVIVHCVSAAIERAGATSGPLVLRLHADDASVIRDEKLPLPEAVQIQVDSTIEHGGCIVETPLGKLDARLTTRLAEVERAIRAALGAEAES